VLRKIYESKRHKVNEELRKLNNEALYDLYISPFTVWLIILRNNKGLEMQNFGMETS
jgi:hypothetical protein